MICIQLISPILTLVAALIDRYDRNWRSSSPIPLKNYAIVKDNVDQSLENWSRIFGQ